MVRASDDHGGSKSAHPHRPKRELSDFRSRLRGCFGRRADALFELCDALLAAGSVPSPVHLGLAPVHRRGWGSLYAALADGTIGEVALGGLLASHSLSARGTHVCAVDVSPWPRYDAETSPVL